jgi:serine/threonine protein kinase
MQNQEPAQTAQPRPKVFRALGKADPPEQVEIDGHSYHRVDILKHDSWAATALYEGPRGMVVAKFNRQQSVFGLPMQWLGRRLARREIRMLQRLEDLANIPDYSGNLTINGVNQRQAVTHDYVAGHPLKRHEPVNDAFFSILQQLIKDIHARDLAYVDLSKRQNIIVGNDDKPYLIDFQISLNLPGWWPANSWPMRRVLCLFQSMDDYHVLKHYRDCRPDLLSPEQLDLERYRPWTIRLGRRIGKPLRETRRKFLVLIGVRTGKGRAQSEAAPEDAVRREMK